MNRVPLARRTQIINCLVEGNSIRSTERMTGTHRDTIMRLLVEVGAGCAQLMDEQMRELPCRRLQVDEIWAFVGKKQRQLTPADDRSRVGNQWTFVAIDADTKLVPVHRVGHRDLPTAVAFMNDLAGRLSDRVQLTSDALAAYIDATEQAFGADDVADRPRACRKMTPAAAREIADEQIALWQHHTKSPAHRARAAWALISPLPYPGGGWERVRALMVAWLLDDPGNPAVTLFAVVQIGESNNGRDSTIPNHPRRTTGWHALYGLRRPGSR
jgi:hypothetical protein